MNPTKYVITAVLFSLVMPIAFARNGTKPHPVPAPRPNKCHIQQPC